MTQHDREQLQEIMDELVERILRLIEGVGAEAVAEGIETSTQALILRRLGCQLAQGYFYGRPVPADEMNVQLLYSPTLTAT